MPAFKDLTGIVFGKLTVIRMEKKMVKTVVFANAIAALANGSWPVT